MSKITVLAAVLLLSGALFPAVADEIQVTEDNYADLLLNNTILGESSAIGQWKVFHKKGGKRLFYSASGLADDGEIWFLKTGEACTRWTKLRDGQTHCSILSLDGERLSWVGIDGRKTTGKIRKGDYSGWD